MLKSKDIADMFGVSQTTIYNWELKGILKPVLKTPTGRKYFNEDDVKKLFNEGKERD